MLQKAKLWAHAIKRDIVAVWIAAHDPRVPWYVKGLALAVATYALSPIDLIPDFIPVLGYLDDLVIVPLGLLLVVKLIPVPLMAEFRTRAAARQQEPRSLVAAIVIVAIWIGSALLLAWWLWPSPAAAHDPARSIYALAFTRYRLPASRQHRETTMRKYVSSTLLLFVLLAGPAAAVDATYVTQDQVDLTKLLPPPPALQSAEQRRDLTEVLAVQKARTPEQAEHALADASAGLFGFADVLGPNFTAERLPRLTEVLTKVRGDGVVAFSAGKDVWNRPRPFETSHEVNAVGDLPRGSSYPSGNSTVGYLTAIVLANMVPEKSAVLFARGREFGDDRVILGVHYPSDIEAGRMAAVAVATGLMQSESFRKDFAEAKAELRRVLGL